MLSISCCSEEGFLWDEEEEDDDDDEASQEGAPFCSSDFVESLAESLRSGVPKGWV